RCGPLVPRELLSDDLWRVYIQGSLRPRCLAGFAGSVVLREEILVSVLSSFDTSASSDSSAIHALPAVSSSRFCPIASRRCAVAIAFLAAKLPTGPFNACAALARVLASPR